jgi:transcription initiation factor IIE alpha subunit
MSVLRPLQRIYYFFAKNGNKEATNEEIQKETGLNADKIRDVLYFIKITKIGLVRRREQVLGYRKGGHVRTYYKMRNMKNVFYQLKKKGIIFEQNVG